MNQKTDKQAPDHNAIFVELRARGIKLNALAKRLRRSPAAVTFALRGESKTLLQRIDNYLKQTAKKRAA
ncbi:MAG: hypothetical protein HYV29_01630 [Ignavibacteriales bacterium]|nr:hypothetical protein [Ignavibacteriales bacterium]